MISTGEPTAARTFSTAKLTKLQTANSAGEGNDVERVKFHQLLCTSVNMDKQSSHRRSESLAFAYRELASMVKERIASHRVFTTRSRLLVAL